MRELPEGRCVRIPLRRSGETLRFRIGGAQYGLAGRHVGQQLRWNDGVFHRGFLIEEEQRPRRHTSGRVQPPAAAAEAEYWEGRAPARSSISARSSPSPTITQCRPASARVNSAARTILSRSCFFPMLPVCSTRKCSSAIPCAARNEPSLGIGTDGFRISPIGYAQQTTRLGVLAAAGAREMPRTGRPRRAHDDRRTVRSPARSRPAKPSRRIPVARAASDARSVSLIV